MIFGIICKCNCWFVNWGGYGVGEPIGSYGIIHDDSPESKNSGLEDYLLNSEVNMKLIRENAHFIIHTCAIMSSSRLKTWVRAPQGTCAYNLDMTQNPGDRPFTIPFGSMVHFLNM